MDLPETPYIECLMADQKPPSEPNQEVPLQSKPIKMDLDETPYIKCLGPNQALGGSSRDVPRRPKPVIKGLKETPYIECLGSSHKAPVQPPQKVSPMGTQSPAHDGATEAFFEHSSGQRIHTDTLITKELREQYPNLELVVAPLYSSDLMGYAEAGHASWSAIEDPKDPLSSRLSWTVYIPSPRRIDGGTGFLAEKLNFGKFMYRWKDDDFILYIVDGRDTSYPVSNLNQYILATDRAKADALLLEAGKWATELHGEILVFDQGYWQKSAELYQSVLKASWDAVIMEDEMKKAIIDDHISFFDSRDTYGKLQVPWKRGIIYHGPPGNGKTISIKAMMNTLYRRADPIPTLYVRSLSSVSTRAVYGRLITRTN